jgi:probable HAF family extracellular repeat protein
LRTDPTAINDQAEIVGIYTDATAEHAFVYSKGNFTIIDVPDAFPSSTVPRGINNRGQIVG